MNDDEERATPNNLEQGAPDDEAAREALVRERLGGPADYDESGGTGLGRNASPREGAREASGTVADEQQQGRSR